MTPPRKKTKPPFNVNVLQRWVGEQARATGLVQRRLQRWISSMVLAGVLDTIRDEHGTPVFLLKGGVAMELRLGVGARATQDYDAAYRERSGNMLARLDEALRQSAGDFAITRGEAQAIGTTNAIRVQLKLTYRGRSWGTVQLEVAPTEGQAGEEIDRVPAIPLDPYGLQGPPDVPCIAVRYQIAQKLHAVTEVHPDGPANSRFRDLIDLPLLHNLLSTNELPAVRAACVEVFTVRATHPWPPTITIHDGWSAGYGTLAAELDIPLQDVRDAARVVEAMIATIDAAPVSATPDPVG